MSNIEQIDFSSNHNNKLFNEVFTTIRKKSAKYQVGKEYEIYIGKHHLGRAEILYISERHLTQQTNEIMSLLDCGKSKSYLLQLMSNMYGKHIVQEMMYYITIRYISRNVNGHIWLLKNFCERHDINTQLTPEQATLFS